MKYHILGIVGTMTTPIAVDLIRQGNIVTGSDQEKIYPPFSTIIAKNHITLNQPPVNIDQYIVGSSYKTFKICVDEFAQIKKNKLPYISATEYVTQNIIKKNSILVAGSYGKSTISALLSWILLKNNFKPSYFFGAQSVDDIPSLQTTDSDWSVVEADESINGLDTQAKFLYYPFKYLILTSAQWEHKDSYKTAEDNFNAFKKLIEKLPKDGILVYNPQDPDVQKLLPFCLAQKIPYQHFAFQTSLIGEFNQDNVDAVLTLCRVLNFNINKIISLIRDFHGIKRRLEIISQNPLIIDDFAQSVDRVTSTITAVAQTYPNHHIKVFFEPHASFLSYKTSLRGFSEAFKPVSEVILSSIKFNANIPKNDRTTFADYKSEIGQKVQYIPILEDVQKHFQLSLKSDEILLHFSSGGLDGINLLQNIAGFFRCK